MGVKKDIGKALNEKLKDQKVAPNDAVWERIQGSLPSKKKKKLFPLWMQIVGIGFLALLIGGTGYYLNNLYDNNTDNSSEKEKNILDENDNNQIHKSKDVLITDTDSQNNNKNSDSSNFTSDENISDTQKTSEIEKILNNNSNQNSSNNTGTSIADTSNTSNSVNKNKTQKTANKNNRKNNSSKKTNNSNYQNSINYSNNITSNSLSKSNKNNSNSSKNNLSTTVNNKINNNKTDGNKLENNKIGSNKNTINSSTNTDNNFSNLTSDKNTKSNSSTAKTTSNIAINQSGIDAKESEKEKLENEITELKDSVSVKDSVNVAIIAKPEIKKKTPEKKSEWEVGAYIAPTIFGSISQGSSLGEILKDNKKQLNISLSYRVIANFKLSEKLTLRTGFGGTKLHTTTLNASETASDGTIVNLGAFPNLSYDFQKLQNIYTNNLLGSNETLDFKEEISFFEIPVEVVYKFEKKKIDWKVFAGGSIYKISNNYIFAKSSKGTYEIGQGNHYSNYSFSANFGGGLDYKVTKKFNITAEPMFKYYFSTYKRDVYDYKPYSVGISIGASYKF